MRHGPELHKMLSRATVRNLRTMLALLAARNILIGVVRREINCKHVVQA